MLALLLFKQLVELFIIMFMGMILVKVHILKADDSRVLSMICIYLIIPCMILSSFQIEYTPEIRDGFLLALFAAVAAHLLFFLITAVLNRIFHMTRVERASMIYTNCGNLILPLVTALLGKEWIIYCSAFIVVQTVFVWTHGAALISGQKKPEWKKILTNVNLIVIVVGLILFLSGIRLPSVVEGVTDTLGSTIGPVSMIMIGMLLGDADWKEIFGNRRLYLISFLKMIVVPVLVLFAFKCSGLSGLVPQGKQILMLTILASSAPAAATVTQLAQLYEVEQKYAGIINVMTTLLCVFTMPVMIAIYQM